MKRVRVLPALTISTRRLVKTNRFQEPLYIGDPINALKIFNEKRVDELCVLDISAAQPDLNYIKVLTGECFMPLAYGGGITTVDQARKVLAAGVEKIVLGRAAHRNPDLIKELSSIVGSQSIVVSIDVKDNWLGKPKVYVENGKINTGIEPAAYAHKMQTLGAGEILLQSISKDGMQKGYDLELIRKVAEEVTIPIIASGGAASVQDFLNAVKVGASAVAAGAMFVYKGPHKAVLISYPDEQLLMDELYQKL